MRLRRSPAPPQAPPPAALQGADQLAPRSHALAHCPAAGQQTSFFCLLGSWWEAGCSWEAGGCQKRREDAASGIRPPLRAHRLARTAGSSYLLTAKEGVFFSLSSPAPPRRLFHSPLPDGCSFVSLTDSSYFCLLTGGPDPASPHYPPHPHGAWSAPPTPQLPSAPCGPALSLELQMSSTGYLLNISSGNISQAPHTQIFNINASFVFIKGISKRLIPNLETSKLP